MNILVPFWKDIEKWGSEMSVIISCGVKEYIKAQLGEVLQDTTVNGANLALRITKEDYQKGGSISVILH